MSIDLVDFGWILLLTTAHAVELSVFVGVGGCVYPISYKVLCTGTVYFALKKSAFNLD